MESFTLGPTLLFAYASTYCTLCLMFMMKRTRVYLLGV
jgi:hypothetical protein